MKMNQFAATDLELIPTARPQIPKVLLVGLGVSGHRILHQVAKRVGELSPSSLALTRFILVPNQEGEWQNLSYPEMAAHQLPQPAQIILTRQEVYREWRDRLTAGCQALQRAAFEVMDPDIRERLAEQGLSVLSFIEIYVAGDLVDPICSGILIPLLHSIKEQFLPDISIVVSAFLSVARLSDPALSSNEGAMAYAALKELNFAMSEAACNASRDRPKWGGLLDHCYLMDRVLEGEVQEALPQTDYTLDLIGGFLTGLFLANLRSVNQAVHFFRSSWNERNESPQGVGFVASIGYASIVLPVETIASYLGHLEARRLIGFGLLRPESSSSLPLPSRQLTEELDLAPDSIRRRLSRSLDGSTLTARIEDPALNNLPLSRWPNHLRRITEVYERGQWQEIIARIDGNEHLEIDRVLGGIGQCIDACIRTQPLGSHLAEQLISDLDKQIEDWQANLSILTSVPGLERINEQLRRAIAGCRPLWVLVPHMMFVALLALALGLSVPYGWAAAGLILLVVSFWFAWSQWIAPGQARQIGEDYVDLLRKHFEAPLSNYLSGAMTRLYRTLRTSLGYGVVAEGGQDATEVAALHRWRDTLAGAVALLENEPDFDLNVFPYGERPVIEREKLLPFYHQYTSWSPTEIAVEFLEEENARDPEWNWRGLDSATLANQAKEFCVEKYRKAFDQVDLDLMAIMESKGRDQSQNLKSVLHQLCCRADPLVRRSRLLYLGSEPRRRFLLLHEPSRSVWARLAQEEGLVPVLSRPANYLGILQMESRVAIPDLVVVPRLFHFYQQLPNKEIAHGEPTWVRLPELMP